MDEETKFKTKPTFVNTDKNGDKFRLAVTRAAKRQREQQKRQIYNSETSLNINSPKIIKKIQTPKSGNGQKINENDELSYSIPTESPHSPHYESVDNQKDNNENKLSKPQRQEPFVSIPININSGKTATVNEFFLQEEEDLDDVVTGIINDLYMDSMYQSTSSRWKSILFKGLDSILRVLVVVIGIVIGVLGRDAVNNQTQGTDNYEAGNKQIALAVTILGFSISGLSEIRDQFMFKDRSVILRRCYRDFEKIGHELLILRASGKDPVELLLEISEIEQKLNEIDMRAFDGQMVPSTSPQQFRTIAKNRSRGSSSNSTPPKVVGAENIPFFKSKAIGSIGVPDKNPNNGDIELTILNE